VITTLTIGGTGYGYSDGTAAAAGIFDLRLRKTVEIGEGDCLTFTVAGCGANAPFVPGVPVTLSTDVGGLIFSGDLDDPEQVISELGIAWAYTCTDLKHRANRVTIAGLDGSGVASFNLRPDDSLYLYATSGNTVGAILRAVLQASANADALDSMGVGAYASLSPPTLPSLTLADLAALGVVPAEPVQLQGESILNALEQFILRWHPQYALWVQPDGVIRVRSIFDFAAQAFTVPTNATSGDPIEYPAYSVSCKNCFTAISIRGLDIDRFELAVSDGTLVKGWSAGDQAAWTIDDFLQPKDASDDGDLSAVTSTSCTVTSDHATTHWPANFWNGERGGWIQFLWTAGTGIDIHEERLITSCTAMTPGGPASIGWDSSLPLAGTNYDRYHIRGLNSPLALVDRKFFVGEPGNTVAADPGPPSVPAHAASGRETFVGSHLYPRFPKGTWLQNLSSTQQIFYPAAYVRWSRDGTYPWFEVPIKCQVNPIDGSITLTEPAVSKFGDPVTLEAGYPTAFADGLWSDVRAVVPYNRGGLEARWPTSGHSGTAYTKYGIQRVKVIPYDALTWAGDVASMRQLAAEHLAVMQDAIIRGSVTHNDLPADFDPFVMGYGLTFTFPGLTTQIDGEVLPVRSMTCHWPEDGPLHRFEFEFSNLRRPFEGDSRFIHPGLSGETFGTQDGGVWVGGNVGGFSGSADAGDWNSAMQEAGQATPPIDNPLSRATADNPLADAGRSNPLSDAMRHNPLADQGNPLADAMGGPNPIERALSGAGDQGGAGLDFDPANFDASGLGRKSGGRTQGGPREAKSADEQQTEAKRADRLAREAGVAKRHDARVAGQDSPDFVGPRSDPRGRQQERREDRKAFKARQQEQADDGKDAGRPINPDRPAGRKKTLREQREGDDNGGID
jgi:hypothetical protein